LLSSIHYAVTGSATGRERSASFAGGLSNTLDALSSPPFAFFEARESGDDHLSALAAALRAASACGEVGRELFIRRSAQLIASPRRPILSAQLGIFVRTRREFARARETGQEQIRRVVPRSRRTGTKASFDPAALNRNSDALDQNRRRRSARRRCSLTLRVKLDRSRLNAANGRA